MNQELHAPQPRTLDEKGRCCGRKPLVYKKLMRRPCMALVHVSRPPDPLAWMERARDISLHLWHCWAAWPDDCNSLEYCGGEWC